MSIGVRLLPCSVLLLVAALGAMAHVQAATIAIIGTGNVAQALGPQFAKLGHEIVYGSRDPARDSVRELIDSTGSSASAASPGEAAQRAQIIVLAVPWNTVEAVVASLGDLSGKIILDPTNPRAIGPDGLRDYASAGSNGELIQNLAPTARVVKAFNTMTAGTMTNPASAGGPVTVPLVGNDAEAKATVAELAAGIGFETLDLGPIRFAHVVEGMYLVWGNARQSGHAFEYYFRRPLAN